VVVLWFLVAPQAADANQITGLQSPHSFLADPSGEQYFISNTNGEPDAKDNNGFISRLDRTGKIVALKFIQGGQADVTLHAPKGMALVGQALYVTDLDTLQGFDKETGRPLLSVSLAAHGRSGQPVALVDVAHDGHGSLYLSDTDANTIYHVDTTKQHLVSILVRDQALAGPRGLAVHPKTGHLIVASWHKGKIFEVTALGQITELVSNGFFSRRFNNLDGVDFDSYGNMYVSDFTAGKVWRMRPDRKFDVIAEFLASPADIGVDRRNHLILVPYEYGNAAEMNGLEAPASSRAGRKRDLSDYGLGWRKGGPEEK
jgi:DNA-binding beta-propeller fold protein YncE